MPGCSDCFWGVDFMNQEEIEGSARQPQAPGRTEKHLARGLEDVSYLFLSDRAAGAGSRDESSGGSTVKVSPHPGERSLFIMADRSQALQRDSLISLLNANTGVLEEGLKAIDMNVPLDDGSSIDLIAVDQFNKLNLIDIDISGGDELLVRGICHFDWFVRNIPIVRRMYHGRVIDFSAQPRIFLVAHHYSTMLRCAAQRITCIQINCYQYHAVAASNGTGIFLTR